MKMLESKRGGELQETEPCARHSEKLAISFLYWQFSGSSGAAAVPSQNTVASVVVVH